MHGDDGCGCGHAHGETMMENPTPTAPTAEASTRSVQVEGGCGEGCGCGANATTDAMMADSCGDGGCCGGGSGMTSEMARLEGAAMQGFLSGLYASTMPADKLADYLAVMSQQEGSEFARPASILASALQQIPADVAPDKPITTRLLAYVSGEPI